MAYVADLHIHSRFSRACSSSLNVPNLVEWAKYKGIDLLGTGDFLHPLWLTELKSQLKEDGSGFLSWGGQGGEGIKFVLSVEISSIYSQKGRGRRVHNLIFLPDFVSAEKFQKELLSKRATLGSDGRPVVGIPSKELLSMILEISDQALFIPAHAWTPWFGIFGSQSGYDSLKECFEDLVDYVYGIETGLSSDPAMNWRIPELDDRSILSFSDAHSLPNLGREVTVFEGEFTYEGLYKAIKRPSVIPANVPIISGSRSIGAGIQLSKRSKRSEDNSPRLLNESSSELDPRRSLPRTSLQGGDDRVAGTIEFYPEEGKYHYTGHRNCNIKYTPEDTKAKGTICPVCKKGLTVGVMERVEELANRQNQDLKIKNQGGVITTEEFSNRAGYRMLVPLLQIIAESFSTAPTTQKVLVEYKKLTGSLGSEIKILTKVDISDIAKLSGTKIAEGVDKVRKGDLGIDPGYDGVYGVVKIWSDTSDKEKEEVKEQPQLGLFD